MYARIASWRTKRKGTLSKCARLKCYNGGRQSVNGMLVCDECAESEEVSHPNGKDLGGAGDTISPEKFVTSRAPQDAPATRSISGTLEAPVAKDPVGKDQKQRVVS